MRLLIGPPELWELRTQLARIRYATTFDYWAYQARVDIAKIRKLLNHSAPSVTLAYIGITKEELDKVYINLNL